MNVLAWSLVYIEKEVKDYKLGLPTGYTLTAPVAEAEAFYAGTASDNLVNNLLGFRSLFEGCGPEGEGLGFDDWLIAAGHTELAADISQAWASAFTAVSALPAMHSASAEQLDHAYLKVKALTDLLKNELLGAGSPLNLDLPATVEGDTD
jgi:predicted lipoprotein